MGGKMGYGKTRPMSHIKGEQGVKILKEIFPASWVVREYSPDYGIDLDVEIFEEHNGHFRTTGEHIYFQVKATESPNFDTIKITPRFNVEKDYKYFSGEIKTIKVIKFIIDTDLLFTVEKMGSAVPVILSVVDLTTKNAYFICLNDYIEKIIVPENSDYAKQETKIIYIPIENKINSQHGLNAIAWYAKRPKLYALFNKINYQKREIIYCDQFSLSKRLHHFLKIILRSDAWSASNYFGAMQSVKHKIDYYVSRGITEEAEQIINNKIQQGEDIDSEIWEASYCTGLVSFRQAQEVQSLQHLWDNLCLMGDVFEDVAKEAFLPTSLGIDISDIS